jgi:hypothetical protein
VDDRVPLPPLAAPEVDDEPAGEPDRRRRAELAVVGEDLGEGLADRLEAGFDGPG